MCLWPESVMSAMTFLTAKCNFGTGPSFPDKEAALIEIRKELVAENVVRTLYEAVLGIDIAPRIRSRTDKSDFRRTLQYLMELPI